MFTKWLESSKELTNSKLRNPFFGTYILVWIIRNWELIYSLFNFDNTMTLDDKIACINEYFGEHHFISGVFWNILIAIGVMIVSYGLMYISGAIVTIYERRLKPSRDKNIDKGSVVSKERFDVLEKERDDFIKRNEALNNSLASSETKLSEKDENESKLLLNLSKLEETNHTLKSSLTNEGNLLTDFKIAYNGQKRILSFFIEALIVKLNNDNNLELFKDFYLENKDKDKFDYDKTKLSFLEDLSLVGDENWKNEFTHIAQLIDYSVKIVDGGHITKPLDGIKKYLKEHPGSKLPF